MQRFKRAIAAGGLVLAVAACDDERSPPPDGEVFVTADGVRFTVETVARGLEVPWSLAFAPDGRLFVTERPGRVRIIRGTTLDPRPALTLDDVNAEGEGGLLGLTLDPGFAASGWVYLVYTARRDGDTPVNRLVRYREVDGELGEAAVLLDEVAGAGIHNGSRVRFGPDGRLYMTMGDANDAEVAQDLAALNGRILRLNPDGTTPRDNPFASPTYSYGHRNPQGLDWHPASGDLWATEHGASGNDELNLVQAGRNYGWPVIEANETRPGMEPPIRFYSPAIAPSGASFYRGAAFPAFQGNLFFATLRGQHLHRVRFDRTDPRRVLAEERLLEGRFGRLRDVVSGPDGALYVSTSNRDGRAQPAADDDRILRLVPPR